MKKALTNTLSMDKNPKLTPLRQVILDILRLNKKPMGAYDILNKLKSKKKPNAEPPTVYRVLDFLVENKLVHRIEAENTYVCCSHSRDDTEVHQSILFLCKNCNKSFELEDKDIFISITKFSKKHALEIDDSLIEMKGICQKCASK